MRQARLFWVGWQLHLKSLSRSPFFILISAVQPVIYATIAFMIARSGRFDVNPLQLAIGAGLMAMWSSTLYGSGSAILWQRWNGTLELLMAAPVPFAVLLLPQTMATATVGLYGVVATLVWSWLLFGVSLEIAQPLVFVISIVMTLGALGLLGLVIASVYVLHRQAQAFSNMLEYPLWLLSGLLVPVALLPPVLWPASWALAPTWGARAIREAAIGGQPIPALIACALLSLAYVGIAMLAIGNFERLARGRGTLALR